MTEPVELRADVSTQTKVTDQLAEMPWWFLFIFLTAIYLVYSFYFNQTYQEIFAFLKDGFIVTIRVTLIAYSIAVTIGLLTGLARVSKNPILYNVASVYVQIMRGVPILVTILYVAFVITPMAVEQVNKMGVWLAELGLLGPDNVLALLGSRTAGLSVSFEARAITALAISYGAFSAEIFRAGIESIGRGQMEAARSLGMSYLQSMRYIILPQAVRRVLPPLGNDFIAMLKESSLVSALGVKDITQLGKLYASSSFEYLKTFNIVAFMYLFMTVLLSLGVKFMEKRLRMDG
ncbi:MAG: amino acid ABC transporter permease [Chloroflexi bacterium]|nr:MAG: amino acid ABC transporter permease [Chloroflexota bacterium]